MQESAQGPKTKAPKWFYRESNIVFRNEVENATADLFWDKGWRAKNPGRKDLTFHSLDEYLPARHKRWNNLKDYVIKTREQPCMRSLMSVFHGLI